MSLFSNIEEQIQNITFGEEDDDDENDNNPRDECAKDRFLSPNQYQNLPIIKRNSYQNITEIEIPSPTSLQSLSNSPKNSLREIGTSLSDTEAVVYATINLEDKHSRRALRSTESPEKRSPTPEKTPQDSTKVPVMTTTSDYEEVGMYIENDGSEDETIYEPVEIPKTTNHAAALWQNLKKINVDALWLDLTRKMREKGEGHETDPHTFGTFREFKKKLGDHRRILKARMQKMYHRSDSRQSSSEEKEIPTTCNGDRNSVCSSNSHTCNGIPLPGLADTKLFAVNDNNVIKSVSSHKSSGIVSKASKLKARITFGSLGRVKKSRTSMFFEEFVPAKKITTTNNIDTEFKKELMSVVCETKIPEKIGEVQKEEQVDAIKS